MTRKISLKNSALTLISALAVSVASANSGPEIRSIEGSLEKGSTLTIHGEGFSEKPNARPWFVWEADHGEEPRKLSRNPNWTRSPSGSLTNEIVAPNSSRAFRFDHGPSSGAALAGVEFDSDELLMFRRTYEDFDTSEDYAIRTRIVDLDGEVKEGQTVTGIESGATGVVHKFEPDGNDRWRIFYTKSGGSINENEPIDFVYGEEMETETASFTNSEGNSNYPTGTFRTFNFKTLRLWSDGNRNNLYVGTGQTQRYDVMPEHTDGKLWNSNMDISLRQRPKEWKSEELYYRSSSLNEKDGAADFRFDNTRHYDHGFRTRNDAYPNRYDIIYQSQVSNGAQPRSYIYYDHIYIDDSWHHVALCAGETWEKCDDKAIQIPLEWDDNEIAFEFNYRHLDKSEDVYLYVVDGERSVNSEGYRLCLECPEPASGLKVQ